MVTKVPSDPHFGAPRNPKRRPAARGRPAARATADPARAATDPGRGTTDPARGTTDPAPATTDPAPATADPARATTDPAAAGDSGGRVAALLDWYAAHARDLPWRRSGTTPWGVMVSEFMLQQTPVARVVPVWREWLERWPSPTALAAEPSGAAIRAWGRLGYPRRALWLHGCATQIAHRHGGVVPSEVDDLLALPGVGQYTARAVAAFAFRRRVPVVDTNVRRVLARAVLGLPDAGPATTAADLAGVAALLPDDPPVAALASAALMELGAIRCTARSPQCTACPWQRACAWRLAGAPAGAGPARRTQPYAGTDRQVRGLLLGVLRESLVPVPRERLDLVWPLAGQRDRALDGLLADGLVERCAGADEFRLPGGSHG